MGARFQAAVQDADEAVAELTERGVAAEASGALLVIAGALRVMPSARRAPGCRASVSRLLRMNRVRITVLGPEAWVTGLDRRSSCAPWQRCSGPGAPPNAASTQEALTGPILGWDKWISASGCCRKWALHRVGQAVGDAWRAGDGE